MILPYDCLYHILKYLRKNHFTLFNCLLVNRFWCRTTIPFLYADPFKPFKANNYLIVLSLILTLNKTEILQLKNILKLIDINVDINIDNIINYKYKPLFDYPKYLEYYECHTINDFILRWVESLLNTPSNKIEKISENFTRILRIFHRLILS